MKRFCLWPLLLLAVPLFPQKVKESFVPLKPAQQASPEVPAAPPAEPTVEHYINTNALIEEAWRLPNSVSPPAVPAAPAQAAPAQAAPKPAAPWKGGTPADHVFQPINGIVLDAGHGGRDPGAIGNGIREKWLVMSVLKKLHSRFRLNKNDLNVYVTRRNDTFLSLEERVSKTARWSAPASNNVLFVSIHGNSARSSRAEGLEIYTLSDRASDPEALEVERLENAGFSKDDIDQTQSLFSLLADLIRDGTRKQSEWLAGYVYNETLSQIRREGGLGRGMRKANFFVLKYNTVPSVLIEVGYISHPGEAKRLRDSDYHDKLAEGIYKGIVSFIDEYNRTEGFTKTEGKSL